MRFWVIRKTIEVRGRGAPLRGTAMLMLPISMVTALFLGLLAVEARLRRRPWLYSALLAVCALQSVIVSYPIGPLHLLQPVTATFVPPLAWITFQSTAIRPLSLPRDLVHLAAPAFTAFCVAFAPAVLDVVVPGAFLAYGGAILVLLLRGGSDALPLMRLEAGERPDFIWRAIAAALILSAASDWLIAVAAYAGALWLKPWIFSLSSSLALICFGFLMLSQSLVGDAAPDAGPGAAADEPDESAGDAALMEALRGLMETETLYLDPDLTLARLARRLRVPAKALSATINRASGGNVSRFVNDYRVRHACARLAAGASVTAAMLESGFNTKSNFNREFLRVAGRPPSAWLAERQGQPQ